VAIALAFAAPASAQDFGNIPPQTVIGNSSTTAKQPAQPIYGINLDVRQFGTVDPTGANDSYPAFQAALNYAAAQGARLVVPAGKYRLNTALTATVASGASSIAIQGDGQGLTTLNWPNAAGGLTVTMSMPLQSAVFRGFTVTTGQAGGGTGITLTNLTCATACSLVKTSVFDHVGAQGSDGPAGTNYWNTGFQINSASNVMFRDIFVSADSTFHGNGVNLVGTATHVGAVYNFSGANFSCVNTGIVYGTEIQGVAVTGGSNFTCGNVGIDVPASEAGLDQLTVTNSQFDVNVAGIRMSTGVAGTMIGENMFILGAGTVANAIGLDLINPGGTVSIVNNSFQSGATGAIGIYVAAGAGVIAGNTMQFVPTGIKLDTGTTNWIVTAANTYPSSTTPISNLGANQVDAVLLNPNAVKVNATTSSSSPTTGALLVAGGAGVAGSIYSGANVEIVAPATFTGFQLNNGTNSVASLLGTGTANDDGTLTLSHLGATKIQLVGGATPTFTIPGLASATGNAILCWTTATGAVSQNTAAGCVASDERLKTHIEPLTDSLERVLALHPVSFDWLDATQARIDGRQIGLVAQDVALAFPDAVKTQDGPTQITLADGSSRTIERLMSVQYDRMVAPLIAAIQEQQKQIAELRGQITTVRRRVSR
jgi:Chaperone of endosialidase